ncbi:hypothetical protein F1654_02465 [Alkalicaulis satelles]|uniref:Uncharacterized protein n=1 Tax=Alkalicaulis satelles TaxID=2609175 RepID=A0A5M6ZRH1_9PROT|nr:hypothetical protein [Alkalicaulis satelles]KAA5804881.1 hypothetical protein F1654_02465 [Alkalicaulis satelles]
MVPMIEVLVSGLVLAAVSALAWIAYKHPKGYQRIYGKILLLGGTIYLGVTIYWVGFIDGQSRLRTKVIDISPNYNIPMSELSTTIIYAPGWAFLIYIAFAAYVIFLSLLPNLLKED